jgi:ATP-dependent DNA ligase
MREMQWVTPEMVVQIGFAEWTAEGRLRHAAFVGVGHDKEPGLATRQDRSIPSKASRPRY